MKTFFERCWNPLLTIAAIFCSIILCHQNVWAGASSQEIKQWVDTHNQFRAQHQVGPVTWSETEAAHAQAFIDTCPTNHSDDDDDERKYGENLGMSWGYIPSISNMVTGWYDEEENYDYSNPSLEDKNGEPLGHFTQVVWNGTKEIGCAWKTNCPGKYTTVWVCQYTPPGNNRKNLTENVFPKKAVAVPRPPSGFRVSQ